eukprot:gene6310-7032_t
MSRKSTRSCGENLGSLEEDEEIRKAEIVNNNIDNDKSTKQHGLLEEDENKKVIDQSREFDVLEKMRNIHQLVLRHNNEGKRTPMGTYIPAEGKQRLTQLAVPTPGPTDYNPKMTISRQAAPQYSIVGKEKKQMAQQSPGPNKYNTQQDLVWKDRKITLKGKGRMLGVGIKTDVDNSVGPAAYDVTHRGFGIGEKSKYTMGLKGMLRNGPPDRLVNPVDTIGFGSPGPAEYNPRSSYKRHGVNSQSFGLLLRKKDKTNSPGPAEYNIEKDKANGPLYSFGARLKSPPVMCDCTPGPGSYQIGTTIGKSVAKSISGRQIIKKKDVLPSPNTYTLPSSIGKGPKNQMTYRAFETAVESTPGPTEYSPLNENLPKGPTFTCRTRCRPGYPDILHHSEHAVTRNPDVGPNTYYPNRCISKNDKPAYSMGTKSKQKIENTPGPTTYNVKHTTRTGNCHAPAFSIGKRIDGKKDVLSPGPAVYYPIPKRSTTSYSISGWNRKKYGMVKDTCSNLPAANAYGVHGQTRKGKCRGPAATLKGRPSPFVYSGFSRPMNV